MEKTKVTQSNKGTSGKIYEWLFVIVVSGSFIVWLTLIFIEGNDSPQFDLFFRSCKDFLADSLNTIGYSGQRNVYENTMYTSLADKNYPPLAYVIFYLFSRLVDMEKYYEASHFLSMYTEQHFFIIFLICAIVFLLMFYELIRNCKNGNQAIKIGVALSCMVSLPVIYTVERANILLVSCFFVIFFVFYYDSENKVLKELALIALALSFGLKITPAVFGILLLYNKQWNEAIRSAIYGLLLGFLPFLFFEGGMSNIFKLIRNLMLHAQKYTSDSGCTIIASLISFGFTPSDFSRIIVKYLTYVICLLLLLFPLVYKEKWQTILAVTMVLLILPSHSGSYCVLYMIPALITFLNQKEHRNSDILVLISFICTFIDIQSTLRSNVFNYHLSILFFVVYLLIEGGKQCFLALNSRRKLMEKPVI